MYSGLNVILTVKPRFLLSCETLQVIPSSFGNVNSLGSSMRERWPKTLSVNRYDIGVSETGNLNVPGTATSSLPILPEIPILIGGSFVGEIIGILKEHLRSPDFVVVGSLTLSL